MLLCVTNIPLVAVCRIHWSKARVEIDRVERKYLNNGLMEAWVGESREGSRLESSYDRTC